MKKIVLFSLMLVGALSFVSCDNQTDVFEIWNEKPQINFFKQGLLMNTLRDSAKVGFPIELTYRVDDEEELNAEVIPGVGLAIETDSLTQRLTVVSDKEGLLSFSVRAVDFFGVEGSAEVTVFSFVNFPPVAVLSLRVVEGRLIEINASASYDLDERFGGGLSLFEYQIGSFTGQSPLAKINYGFGSPGVKKIRARVKDTDGVWSEWVEATINLN